MTLWRSGFVLGMLLAVSAIAAQAQAIDIDMVSSGTLEVRQNGGELLLRGTDVSVRGAGGGLLRVGNGETYRTRLDARATLNIRGTSGDDVIRLEYLGELADVTVDADAGEDLIVVARPLRLSGSLDIRGGEIRVNEAVSARGNVSLVANSPLTISANVLAAGAITITATDAAAPGDDLTINPGVTVQSTGSSVTLNAGDDYTAGVGSLVDAATMVTINGDAGDADPGVGSMVDVLGAISAGTTVAIDTVGDDDTLNLDLSTTTTPSVAINTLAGIDAINITGLADPASVMVLGGDPTGSPGDVLDYSGPAATLIPTGADSGTINLSATANVEFDEIEAATGSGLAPPPPVPALDRASLALLGLLLLAMVSLAAVGPWLRV